MCYCPRIMINQTLTPTPAADRQGRRDRRLKNQRKPLPALSLHEVFQAHELNRCFITESQQFQASLEKPATETAQFEKPRTHFTSVQFETFQQPKTNITEHYNQVAKYHPNTKTKILINLIETKPNQPFSQSRLRALKIKFATTCLSTSRQTLRNITIKGRNTHCLKNSKARRVGLKWRTAKK